MSKANPLILTKKENEMVEHIPGPYYNNGGIIGPKSVFNSSDNAVCVVGEPNNQTPQDTANARFIIRACRKFENTPGFEQAKSMINQRPCLKGNPQDKRRWRMYWLGFAFALVEFRLITRAQYAQLQIIIEEA